MKPPNPKNATSKPLVPVSGFSVNGCGFSVYQSGVVKIEAKRNGKRIIAYTDTGEFANIMWNYLVEQEKKVNEQ